MKSDGVGCFMFPLPYVGNDLWRSPASFQLRAVARSSTCSTSMFMQSPISQR
jgi:hypothetical protein